ncbi:MAG: hypothetical protein LUP97_06245 [Methanoregula sp.]|nr:hypothetical protein [Methanoregula sp.]
MAGTLRKVTQVKTRRTDAIFTSCWMSSFMIRGESSIPAGRTDGLRSGMSAAR